MSSIDDIIMAEIKQAVNENNIEFIKELYNRSIIIGEGNYTIDKISLAIVEDTKRIMECMHKEVINELEDRQLDSHGINFSIDNGSLFASRNNIKLRVACEDISLNLVGSEIITCVKEAINENSDKSLGERMLSNEIFLSTPIICGYDMFLLCDGKNNKGEEVLDIVQMFECMSHCIVKGLKPKQSRVEIMKQWFSQVKKSLNIGGFGSYVATITPTDSDGKQHNITCSLDTSGPNGKICEDLTDEMKQFTLEVLDIIDSKLGEY